MPPGSRKTVPLSLFFSQERIQPRILGKCISRSHLSSNLRLACIICSVDHFSHPVTNFSSCSFISKDYFFHFLGGPTEIEKYISLLRSGIPQGVSAVPPLNAPPNPNPVPPSSCWTRPAFFRFLLEFIWVIAFDLSWWFLIHWCISSFWSVL